MFYFVFLYLKLSGKIGCRISELVKFLVLSEFVQLLGGGGGRGIAAIFIFDTLIRGLT